jgi:formimidoylglutamate deiminase
MSAAVHAYLPKLLLSDGRVRHGAALIVRDGVVVSVGRPPPGARVHRLDRTAILPGFVSAHSHAFQRAIRGRTEYRNHPVDDFWTWREAMYAAAERLSPSDLEAVSRMCFLEMARAGITCVGEFHYLHRDPAGKRYADPNELSLRVLRAARKVGLRVVLLRVAYARAGFGVPDNPRQLRFIEGSPEEYLENLDRLAQRVRKDALVTVGAAPHSVRACPADWITAIAAESNRRGWPLHLHVSEQPAEVTQSKAEHGLTPPLLLERIGALSPRTTAVHAVHLEADDVAAFARSGATVCACPTTERNLGDGIVRADLLLGAGIRLAVGSDSECEIDPLEDVRGLEYHLRLLHLRRAVLDSTGGDTSGLGERLIRIASEGGMHALGLQGGCLRPGEPADFVVVDLDDPSIAGSGEDDLPAAVAFGLKRTAVRDVYVAGNAIVRDRSVENEEKIVSSFRSAMRRLWGGSR